MFGQAAIEAAAPATGERVLDIGCGAGASSLALAARVGAGGHVLGVDISEPLIGRARALAPRDTPVQFRVADASSAELPEGAFDILFSRFGVMFFDDPTAAFAHMRRALQPGGRVAFARRHKKRGEFRGVSNDLQDRVVFTADRVVLKVKIESFSKCRNQQTQALSRVVFKVSPHTRSE